MTKVQRLIYAFTLVALISGQSHAQTEKFYSVHFQGNSSIVKSLSERYRFDSDTLILIMLTPMVCPRCEGFIPAFLEHLHSTGFKGGVLGVIDYPRVGSAGAYLRRRQFPFPSVIDTAGKLFSELGIVASPPVITVWTGNGKFINALTLYGVTVDDSLVRAALSTSSSIGVSPIRIPRLESDESLLPTKLQIPRAIGSVILEEDSSQQLSSVHYFSVDESDRLIEVEDNLTLTPKEFKLDNGAFQHEYKPDYKLRKRFSPTIADTLFKNLEENNITNSMLFEAQSLPHRSSIIVTASLPEVYFKRKHTDSIQNLPGQLSYRNARTLISYSAPEYQITSVTQFARLPDSVLAYFHTEIKAVSDSEIVLEVAKGYPTLGFSYRDTVSGNNPLTPSFYENAPLFAVYNLKDGSFKRFIGALAPIHQRFGAGYALAKPVATYAQGKYWYAQQLVDKVISTKGDTVTLKSYFNPKMEAVGLLPDSLPPTTAIDRDWNDINARIIGLGVVNQTLRVVWRIRGAGKTLNESTNLVVQCYDLNSKHLTGEWQLPQIESGERLRALGAPFDQENIYALYQSPTRSEVYKYKLQ